MTLQGLKNYYEGQRFILKATEPVSWGDEVWELNIMHIEDLDHKTMISCYYRFLESPFDNKGSGGHVEYEIEELDDLIDMAYNNESGFSLLGWMPIKPKIMLPEEYFKI